MNEPIRPRADALHEHAEGAMRAMKAPIIEAHRQGRDALALRLTQLRDEWGRAVASDEATLARARAIDTSVEASLRRELAEAKANEQRWCDRIKALEARLAHIASFAGGHLPELLIEDLAAANAEPPR